MHPVHRSRAPVLAAPLAAAASATALWLGFGAWAQDSAPPPDRPSPGETAGSEERTAPPDAGTDAGPNGDYASWGVPRDLARRRGRGRERGVHGRVAVIQIEEARRDRASAPGERPPGSRGGSSIDDLLGRALGRHNGAAARPPTGRETSASAGLPEYPGRDQILAALRAVQGDIRACAHGEHGTALTAITVAGGTGNVTSATVSGPFAGTPLGSCVERAVRRARFPRFSRPTFAVRFPFNF